MFSNQATRLIVLAAAFISAAIACSPLRAGAPAAEPSAPIQATDGGPHTVRIAGIVLKWIRGDKDANYRRAEPMIREAADAGAQIVVTTECFLDGYAIADKSIPLDEYRALGEPIPQGPYFQRLSRLARELKIYLVAGMLEADGPLRYNTAVVIDPKGRLRGKYRKQKLGHESVRNTPGEESTVHEVPYGQMGVLICADRTEPTIVRRFAQRGAQFLICPSGGMYGPQRNDPIVQARSRETGLPIVFVHPAEFLVTDPLGNIAKRVLLGDRLLISAQEESGPSDSKKVFYVDLPVPVLAAKRATQAQEARFDRNQGRP